MIAVVLAALIYLGIFSAAARVPDRCSLAPGLSCGALKIGAEAQTGNVYLQSVKLTNALPQRILVCGLECRTGSEPVSRPSSCGSAFGQGGSTSYIPPGDSATVSGSGAIVTPLSNPDGSPYTGPVSYIGRLYCKEGQGENVMESEAGQALRANLFTYYVREGDVTGNMRVLGGDFATTVQPG